MACKEPLLAYRTAAGEIIFNNDRTERTEPLKLSCGKCAGCRLERSRQWAVRIMHEASLYDNNCFVTLTYNEEHLPEGNNLVYRDYQLFMKKLRQAIHRENLALIASTTEKPAWQSQLVTTTSVVEPKFATSCRADSNLRFYMSGEYGTKKERPHFHAILFNLDFQDKTFWRTSKTGHDCYRSETLERLWKHGNSEIGAVTFESAAYVARYILQKSNEEKKYIRIDTETGEIAKRKPEFNNMSRRPGIGKAWLNAFHHDVYPHGQVVTNGQLRKAPRYYDLQLQKADPIAFTDLQNKRKKLAENNWRDNTPARRLVKDTVTRARLKAYKRELN